MSEQDALLDALKRHVATAEPIEADVESLVDEEAPALVAALFALAGDDQVRDLWAKKIDFEQAEVMGKIAWVSSEDEEIEARIDELLESGEAATLVETLARAGIAWDSQAVDELLDHDASRRAAALLLAVANPAGVRQWLSDCEVVEDALDVLRAAALNLSEPLFESFVDWAETLEEVEDVDLERARVDGLMAVVDPKGYARRVLAGDAGIEWLGDMPVVADFLQVHGPTHWLSVLGLLEAVEDPAMELAAMLSVSAAAGMGFEEPDEDEARELLELLSFEPDADTQEWEPIATRRGLGFGIAVAPDDELGLLATQVAAHERLITFDIHSPGIPGLPLSGTSEEYINLDASRALLEGISELDEMPDSTTLAVVRTLDDLRGLVLFDRERYAEHAEAWVDQFLDSDSRAIRLAVRQLLVPLDHEAAKREADRIAASDTVEAALAFSGNGIEQASVLTALEEHAHLEGPLGLDCARRLAMIGSDEALSALTRLWETGTVFRVVFYRDCLVEGIAS